MNLKIPPMPITMSVITRHWKNVNIQDLCYDIESQLENVNLENGELDYCVNLHLLSVTSWTIMLR